MARGTTTNTTPQDRGTSGAKYHSNSVKDAAGDVIFAPSRSYGPRGLRPWYYKDKNGILLPANWTQKIDHYLLINDPALKQEQKVFSVDGRLADIAFEGRKWLNSLYESTQDYKQYEATLQAIGTVAGLINKAYGAIVVIGINLLTADEKKAMRAEIANLKTTLAKLEREAKYLNILKEKIALNQLNDYLETQNSRSANTGNSEMLTYTGIGIAGLIILSKLKRK